jgi:hypothetical protein
MKILVSVKKRDLYKQNQKKYVKMKEMHLRARKVQLMKKFIRE